MGTGKIQVSFPESLGNALKMQEPEFSNEMRKLAVIKLYELGKISSGKAAEVLNMTRISFLEMAGVYQISVFGNPTKAQLEEDLLNA